VKHYSEEDLVLHYYGEDRRAAEVERHLQACERCAATYRDIAGTLAMIAAPEAPERGDQYGLEVWQRIRHKLPEQNRSWFFVLRSSFGAVLRSPFDSGIRSPFERRTQNAERRTAFALAASVAVLVVAAFVVGRVWPRTPPIKPAEQTASTDAARRVFVASVADHLDRSARVLTDIMDTAAAGDISAEQQWADDLLIASRLYRQDAVDAGEQSVADVLDEVERSLIEIVHSPSRIGAADLEQIRRRIDAAALLFKVRVLSDDLREREQTPDAARPRTSMRKTS